MVIVLSTRQAGGLAAMICLGCGVAKAIVPTEKLGGGSGLPQFRYAQRHKLLVPHSTCTEFCLTSSLDIFPEQLGRPARWSRSRPPRCSAGVANTGSCPPSTQSRQFTSMISTILVGRLAATLAQRERKQLISGSIQIPPPQPNPLEHRHMRLAPGAGVSAQWRLVA